MGELALEVIAYTFVNIFIVAFVGENYLIRPLWVLSITTAAVLVFSRIVARDDLVITEYTQPLYAE